MLNKLKITTLAGCMILSLPVLANQNDAFTGFAVELSAGYAHNKVKYDGYVNSVSSSDNDAAFQIGLGYNFPVSDAILLGVGATYGINKTDFGSISYTDAGNKYAVDAKMKQHLSVYFAPGYKVTPDVLVYAKLAYHHAKGEYNDSHPSVGQESATTNGFGFGFGAAYEIMPNVELGLEVQQINFQRKSTEFSSGKPSTTEYNLVMKYRF